MVMNPSSQSLCLVTHTIADEIREHSSKNKRKVGVSTIPPPVKKAKTGGVSINEHAATTTGKSPSIIQKLITQSGQVPSCFGAGASRPEEFVSSFVTPTPDHDTKMSCSACWGPSALENETRTSTAPDQCSPIDDFYDSQTINSAIAQNIYVPNWDVTNDARIDDPIMMLAVQAFSKDLKRELTMVRLVGNMSMECSIRNLGRWQGMKNKGELENNSLPFLHRKSRIRMLLYTKVWPLYIEGFPSAEDEDPPNFRKASTHVLLGEALEASLAHAQRHKWVVSSSLVVVAQDQGTSTSLVASVVPLNSITVDDYTTLDVSMLKTATDSETTASRD
ncbi:hypothetical protein Tco_1118243 [Tanacetum coccineum]